MAHREERTGAADDGRVQFVIEPSDEPPILGMQLELLPGRFDLTQVPLSGPRGGQPGCARFEDLARFEQVQNLEFDRFRGWRETGGRCQWLARFHVSSRTLPALQHAHGAQSLDRFSQRRTPDA